VYFNYDWSTIAVPSGGLDFPPAVAPFRTGKDDLAWRFFYADLMAATNWNGGWNVSADTGFTVEYWLWPRNPASTSGFPAEASCPVISDRSA
jgi:hypothetical protein